MFLSRRRFVQLWERRSAARLPVVYYFVKDSATEQLRCFAGSVRRVRRSRAFVDHSPVYGVLKAVELLRDNGTGDVAQKAAMRGGRFTRSRILDRMVRIPLMPEAAPTVSDAPAAAEPMVASGNSDGGPAIML